MKSDIALIVSIISFFVLLVAFACGHTFGLFGPIFTAFVVITLIGNVILWNDAYQEN